MGRARTKPAPITEVVVNYDLFDLPTAQHKAGLAGLLLQIQHMEKRKRDFPEGAIPVIRELSPTAATLRFTEESVRWLFNDLYAATVEKVISKSKWKGQAPIDTIEEEETDPQTKKVKKVKKYVYERVQPRGHFLRDHLPEMDPTKDWHKLWRDMLWAIPRGNPQSRIPFEQRAEGKDCKEGQEAWADLVKTDKARKKNAFHTDEVAGSLWLGAQATNAEAIPFVGRAEQNLLLHFWPLTALVFAPQQITDEGESEFVGYVLAIPEVADLENFLVDYPQMLEQLGAGARGYRPAEAVIDLPAQGALAFLEHLARLAAHTAEREKLRYAVSSVEYLHLTKVGNNIKSLAAGRVAPSTEVVEEYRLIAGTKDRPAYRNPLFRRGLLLALLKQLEWHQAMAPLLVEKPWPLFIRSEESPRQLPWFWQDAAEKFQQLARAYEVTREKEEVMLRDSPETGVRGTPTPLALLIHRLVQNFVNRRTEEKSGQKWEVFKERKIKDEKTGKERIDVPAAYREAREKVASGTFLEMRSRRGQAFVEHFTATFCSIKQFLPEDEFQIVAAALINEPDNVKTFTLLALSANS